MSDLICYMYNNYGWGCQFNKCGYIKSHNNIGYMNIFNIESFSYKNHPSPGLHISIPNRLILLQKQIYKYLQYKWINKQEEQQES